ncbi:hypothetical protein QYE76_010100 [Lolium multiflorum]|uniref:Uncharacterized protein n=1 Tax=Lolium multiflorum TaxID=4521 RepID=A0AAD8TWJ5_LOLMU|nr:hypothetical protein QYE76_010100 [Lolium multiflorum]
MAARAGLVGSSPCSVQGGALVEVEAEISPRRCHGWSEEAGPAGGGLVTAVCKLGQQHRYEEEASIARGGEEQLDKKLDVKLDMELDMKTSHGRAREEREACARGGDAVQAGARPGQTGRAAGPAGPSPGPTGFHAGSASPNREIHFDQKIVNQKDKDAAILMTWRDYEALRDEIRREFRTQDDELRGSVQEISQKLDATNETVTTMTDQMTDIQRSLQALQLAVDNLTQQQQQEDEDPEM